MRRLLRGLQDIHIGAQVCNMHRRKSVLARAEEITRPAQLEILLGYLKAIVGFGHDLEPRLRRLVIAVGNEHTIALMLPSTDAAAQLVQLAQAEAVGVFDYHQRRVRHVNADLDDRSRNEMCIRDRSRA